MWCPRQPSCPYKQVGAGQSVRVGGGSSPPKGNKLLSRPNRLPSPQVIGAEGVLQQVTMTITDLVHHPIMLVVVMGAIMVGGQLCPGSVEGITSLPVMGTGVNPVTWVAIIPLLGFLINPSPLPRTETEKIVGVYRSIRIWTGR